LKKNNWCILYRKNWYSPPIGTFLEWGPQIQLSLRRLI